MIYGNQQVISWWSLADLEFHVVSYNYVLLHDGLTVLKEYYGGEYSKSLMVKHS